MKIAFFEKKHAPSQEAAPDAAQITDSAELTDFDF
jgi:hypothetical protein